MSVLLAAVLVGGGILLVALGLVQGRRRRVRALVDRLELQYLEQDKKPSAEVISLLLSRSGFAAERMLGGTSVFARLQAVVQRSDWRISPGELAAASAGAAVGGLALGLGVGIPVLGIVLAVAGLLAPYLACSRSVAARRRRFEAQLPDLLDMMAATLESGSTVLHAIELIAMEADEPAATEFGRVVSATRLGTPAVDALAAMAERLDSRDLRWTVQAIAVQQRTGARLAEVLRIVAGVVRSREEVRREIRTLTAEGRLSAYVIAALPFLLFAYFEFLRPDYIRPLFTTRTGLMMTGVGGFLLVSAFVAMWRIVQIEV